MKKVYINGNAVSISDETMMRIEKVARDEAIDVVDSIALCMAKSVSPNKNWGARRIVKKSEKRYLQAL